MMLKGTIYNDELIHLYLPWKTPIGILRRIGLHTYSTSTPVSQLCQPVAVPQDEYNQFNLQNINVPTPPKWKNNENILGRF